MKAIWSGAIGFGLVNIPVKLYSATQDKELDFDMLDKKDLSNIKFKRVNEKTGKEVTWENIVKGYLLNDKYVVLEPEDFEQAAPEKTKMIEISEFVEETEIDPIYYETPYYLAPDKSGVKPYNLLRDALQKTGKAGVGTFVLRTKESIVILKPVGDILLLHKVRFGHEIRDTAELSSSAAKPKPAEVKMAVQLIDQLTVKFDINKYEDTYTERLMKLIKSKAKGGKSKAPVMKIVHSKGTDLMEQLKASLSSPRKKAS